MTSNATVVELRDYVRVIFARGWWILFITVGVVGLMAAYTFYRADRVYEARNEILVTDKFSGSVARDLGSASDWVLRVRRAELDLKRPAPAREIIAAASSSVDFSVSEDDLGPMTEHFKDDMRVEYSREGSFIRLSYVARDGGLAAAVLSLFIKRMIASCIDTQVGELNNEVATLATLKNNLAAEVAAAERKFDEMKTVAPELRLTASTMALLKSGGIKTLATQPSTDQAVGVYLELQREVITIDGEIADATEKIALLRKQIAAEPETVPAQRRMETLPAVREASKRRDDLRLQLAGLLSNSTAEHPQVKRIQAELKSLDSYLDGAAKDATVEIVYEANAKRADMQKRLAAAESDLAGLRERRAKMAENAQLWREKLDGMPAELRSVRELADEYEKKSLHLSQITDQLVQAQIRRSLQLEQVGTYYRPESELTKVPSTYKNRHLVHLLLGVVLGLVTSVFAVYAIEFADHSVKDQRDVRLYTKAPVLGVISDYNQLRAVASRAAWVRAAGLKQYGLALLLVLFIGLLGFASWRQWPRQVAAPPLPESLSTATLRSIDEAMNLYASPAADLGMYVDDRPARVDVTPAVVLPDDQLPQPALSE